jgi:hypothetical protein
MEHRHTLCFVERIQETPHHARPTIRGSTAYRNAVFATFPDIDQCWITPRFTGRDTLLSHSLIGAGHLFDTERFLVVQALIVPPNDFVKHWHRDGAASFPNAQAFAWGQATRAHAHSVVEEPFFIFVEPDHGAMGLFTRTATMDAHIRRTSRGVGRAGRAGRDIGTTRNGTAVYAI